MLRTLEVGLTITALAVAACSTPPMSPPPQAGIVLSTPTSSIVLTKGDRAAVDVTVARIGGFSGPVRLDVSGVPASVAVDFATNPVAGNNASVSIGVSDAAEAGDYALTVTATGDGIAPQTLPIALRITPRVPQTVAVAFCTGFEPNWVAFQDANGAWIRAQPTVAGGVTTFSAGFSTNRGGLATVTLLRGGLSSLLVRFGTPAELAAAGDVNRQACGPAVSETLFGSVAGLGATDFAFVAAAITSHVTVFPTRGTSFDLKGLPAGPQDLVVTRNSPLGRSTAVTGIILRRSLDLPDGTTLPTLDFASAEAFAPAVGNVTVAGIGPEGAATSTRLLTGNGDIPLTAALSGGTDAARPYYALPETQLLAGDLQVLSATANPTADAIVRTATLYFRAPGDRTLALGAPLIEPAFTTVATSPALRLQAQFAPQSDYDQSAAIAYQQGLTRVVTVTVTAAYAQRTGIGYTLVVPDLSGAAGFDPAWALQPGITVGWTAVGTGGTLGAQPVDGAVQRYTQSSGTIAP